MARTTGLAQAGGSVSLQLSVVMTLVLPKSRGQSAALDLVTKSGRANAEFARASVRVSMIYHASSSGSAMRSDSISLSQPSSDWPPPSS